MIALCKGSLIALTGIGLLLEDVSVILLLLRRDELTHKLDKLPGESYS